MAELGPIKSGADSSASAINSSDQVVGSSDGHAVLWESDGQGNATLTDLGKVKGERTTWGGSINDAGQAVGFGHSTSGGGVTRTAFLWENGQMTKLIDLIENSEGIGGLDAFGINERGEIAGAIRGDGYSHAYIARPSTQAPPSPGITVEPTDGLVTTEGFGTDTFTIVLDTQPTDDVTIALSSSDTSEGTVSPDSVTFTATNWDQPQAITVTGVDDADADGDAPYTILTAPAVSGDSDYGGLNAADVDAVNLDDDAPSGGVTVVSVTSRDIRLGGKYNITASIRNEGPAAVIIHVDCEVEDSSTDIQQLTTREVTIEPGVTANVKFNDYSDSSKVSAGMCTAWITVEEDPTAEGSDTFKLK
ncbi:MAG: hypothetical protein ISS72_11475 [Candidatus Brocadiae bacterium]|nr:hypothetical protein [Candidatus Brocadiia bacterium]